MSEDSDIEEIDSNPVLMPIVEISNNKHPHTARSSVYSDGEDAYSDSEATGAEVEDVNNLDTVRSNESHSGRRRGRRKKKGEIDMTPPDKLLKKIEKKAYKYKDNGKVDSAIRELIRCTALARIVYGDGHWRLARAYVNLAQGYFDLKSYTAQTQYHCENARNIMLSGVQTTDSQPEKAKILEVLLNIYYTLGKAQTVQKNFCEAEQALAKAEKIARERNKLASVTSDECTDWDIKIAIAQAKLNGKQQKFASSTSYFDKAIDLTEKQYGRDDIQLIQLYQDLGRVEQAKGKHSNHERAIEMFTQAHGIAGANYHTGSPEIAETAQVLASGYSNKGDPDAETSAESYLNESLVTYQTVYGPNHVKTLVIQDEIARLMVRTEREEEAISMLRSTISPKVEVHGEFSNQVSDTYKMIGSIHLSRGTLDKALKAFKKCHSIESLAHGPNHRRTKETQKTIDILMSNPSVANSVQKSKHETMKNRPRFNTIVKGSGSAGGFKSDVY